MEWSQEKCLRLIEVYKAFPVLWNPSSFPQRFLNNSVCHHLRLRPLFFGTALPKTTIAALQTSKASSASIFYIQIIKFKITLLKRLWSVTVRLRTSELCMKMFAANCARWQRIVCAARVCCELKITSRGASNVALQVRRARVYAALHIAKIKINRK
uniref:Uncharacterized protein n=1 Tax=Sipha flava TaxID=143950 RepID=A0A2S2QAD4_9HEMI